MNFLLYVPLIVLSSFALVSCQFPERDSQGVSFNWYPKNHSRIKEISPSQVEFLTEGAVWYASVSGKSIARLPSNGDPEIAEVKSYWYSYDYRQWRVLDPDIGLIKQCGSMPKTFNADITILENLTGHGVFCENNVELSRAFLTKEGFEIEYGCSEEVVVLVQLVRDYRFLPGSIGSNLNNEESVFSENACTSGVVYDAFKESVFQDGHSEVSDTVSDYRMIFSGENESQDVLTYMVDFQSNRPDMNSTFQIFNIRETEEYDESLQGQLFYNNEIVDLGNYQGTLSINGIGEDIIEGQLEIAGEDNVTIKFRTPTFIVSY